MPARDPFDQVTTATRSPRGLLERLTLSGAPMPRTTSHSVWPSATVPPFAGGGLPAAPSASALASPAPGGGAIPGQGATATNEISREAPPVRGQWRRLDRNAAGEYPSRAGKPIRIPRQH